MSRWMELQQELNHIAAQLWLLQTAMNVVLLGWIAYLGRRVGRLEDRG